APTAARSRSRSLPAPRRSASARVDAVTARPRNGVRHGGMWAALAALTLALAALAPTAAAHKHKHHKPPRIGPLAVATSVDTSSKLEFSVHVHKAKKVHVKLKGSTHSGDPVQHLHDWWQANFSGGPVRDCYEIKITARNGHGKTIRRRHAGRQGTNGCKES